jgi:phosphonate transport system permease protein
VTTSRVAPPSLAPPRQRRLRGRTIVLAGVLVVIHAVAIAQTGFSVDAVIRGWHGIVDFAGQALPPDVQWSDVVRPGLEASLVTVSIGLLGTTLSIPFALALGVFGSRSSSSGAVAYQAARSVMSALRAVPDVVFALIFVTAVGLGPFAGVLALLVHNTGVMGKLWSEAMDEIEHGPVEALHVAGASRSQVVLHAVLSPELI